VCAQQEEPGLCGSGRCCWRGLARSGLVELAQSWASCNSMLAADGSQQESHRRSRSMRLSADQEIHATDLVMEK
jgi:hypothetical protein